MFLITLITNIYVGAYLLYQSVQTFMRELASGMPDLPASGPGSIEELHLLYEVTNCWAIGIVDPGNGQKIFDWDSIVEDMNNDSKRYFISIQYREYTFEECYDNLCFIKLISHV
jgi:hypothetical protein